MLYAAQFPCKISLADFTLFVTVIRFPCKICFILSPFEFTRFPDEISCFLAVMRFLYEGLGEGVDGICIEGAAVVCCE
jgi:hypothetical protein